MSELLLKAVDASHPDPAVDVWHFKSGQPVAVKPDGHVWGSKEGLPLFWILKFPGVPPSRLEKYLRPQRSAAYLIDPFKNRSPDDPALDAVSPTAWIFQPDAMPAAVLERLTRDGQATVGPGGDCTWQELRAALLNRETGLSEAGDLA